jgi:hypothetical protein
LAAPAAVVAAVVVEPPVLAVVDLAHLPVLALAQVVVRRAHRVQLPLLARLLLVARAHLPVVAHLPVWAQPLVAARRVVEAVPLQHLLSRQSCSAAMARSTA